MEPKIILFLLTTIISLSLFQVLSTTAQEVPEDLTIQLHLSPSQIEGGVATYPIGYINIVNGDGFPILTLTDLPIELISEDPSIASVPSEVVISQSRDYVKFDVKVGEQEGTTIIYAIFQDQRVSQKFRVGGINIGVPIDTDLKIHLPVSEMHVGTQVPISVFLEHEGAILQTPQDVKVRFSFQNDMVDLESDIITIKKGDFYSTTTLSTLQKTGFAFIKARTEEPPLDSAINLQVTSSLPSQLQVAVFPEKVIVKVDREIDIFVSLLDVDGNPVLATEDVPLEIFSNVVTLDDALDNDFGIGPRQAKVLPVIKKGQWGFYHKQDNILFNSIDGLASVGAFSSGYGLAEGKFQIITELDLNDKRAENRTINVHTIPRMPADATAIVVYQTSALKGNEDDIERIDDLIESGVLPDHPFDEEEIYEEGDLYPLALDFDDFNQDELRGRVVSSDNKIVEIISPGKINPERSFTTGIIKSSKLNHGEVTISAALKGVGTGKNTTIVVNPLSPTNSTIFSPAGESRIIFNEEGQSDIFVLALDSVGRPSNSQAGLKYLVEPINELTYIKTGDTFSQIPVHSGLFGPDLLLGNTTISVSPIGIGADQNLTEAKSFLIAPSSSDIKISVPFKKVVGGNNVHNIAVVQLVDFFGNPVVVTNDLRVGLESSDLEVIEVPSSVIIPVDHSFVEFPVTTFGNQGIANVTAIARGFSGSYVTLEQFPFIKELVIFPVYPLDDVVFNEPIEIEIFVDDNYATAVGGAFVEFNAPNSTAFPTSALSNEFGELSVLFTPEIGPTASLGIKATKPGYTDDEETMIFEIAGYVAADEGLIFGVPAWVLYVGVGGAVAGIVVVLLVVLRKPKVITEEEEEI